MLKYLYLDKVALQFMLYHGIVNRKLLPSHEFSRRSRDCRVSSLQS
jgi:hypothetical protein